MITKHDFLKRCLCLMLLISCRAFLACSDNQSTLDEGGAEHAGLHPEHADIVRLSAAEQAEFSIAVDTAGVGVIRQHINLTGEIVIDPDRLAHIIPRFPGIVKEVRKRIGDRVSAGEVLAVIESNESLAPYEISSLIRGTVIDMHLTRGEVVNDNTHDIIVADLSKVWADLSVYQNDLAKLKVGQQVTLSGGNNTPGFQGKISYISPTLEKSRRTVTARVIVANPGGEWRPGLFVNAEVVTASIEVPVAVPKTALEMFEEQMVVFVQRGEGYVPHPVKVGVQNHDTVQILEGLAPGDLYVSSGGFTLKAELEKSAFGDGHGH